MNIVKGIYVPSDREKERRLAVHKSQLVKIANRKCGSLLDLNEKDIESFPSNEISRKLSLDSIGKSNKIILNRINKIINAPLKPVVNYDYLSMKKLNSTLEGTFLDLS